MENNKSLDADTQKKIQQLTKEKDEMLDLAMSRGKIVQVIIKINKCISYLIELSISFSSNYERAW